MDKKIALVYHDLSCGTRLLRLAESGDLKAELFASVDAFLERGQYADFACVLLQESLSYDHALQMLLESRRNDLPVIMLTASDDERLRRSEMGIRGAGLFKEPVAGEVLLDALGWMLSRSISSSGSAGDAMQHFGPDNSEPPMETDSIHHKFTPFSRSTHPKNRVKI